MILLIQAKHISASFFSAKSIQVRAVLLLIFAAFALAQPLSAQSRRAYEKAGDKAMHDKDFGAAIQHYAVALERKANDPDVIGKYAECARRLHAYALAEKMYQALSGHETQEKNWPLLDLNLAEVLKNQGKYEEAIAVLEKFRKGLAAGNPEWTDRADAELAACRWALGHRQDTSGIQVVNAGRKINSPYSDFAPFIAGDTLFFSSYRFNKRGDRSKPRTKLTKVMYSVRNGSARELTRGFPETDTAHVAHSTFTRDGHFLFITVCKNQNASDIRCELWVAV